VPEGSLLFETRLSTLDYITTTGFLSLRRCPLSHLLDVFSAGALLPLWPAARFGRAVHSLLEILSRSRLEETPQDPESILDRLVSTQEREMSLNWLERHLIPISSSVKRYEVLRLSAIRHCRAIRANRANRRIHRLHRLRSALAEKRIRSRDGLVRGRIDLVRKMKTGTILCDFKSGRVFGHSASGARRIRTDHRHQLELYAALYEDSTGEWPVRIEIYPVGSKPIPLEVVPSRCQDRLIEARSLLVSTNAAIQASGGNPRVLQRRLAAPSSMSCRFCLYRPGCEPYWQHRGEDRDDGWPADIRGIVESCGILGNSNHYLQSTTGLMIRGLSAVSSRHPAIQLIRSGSGFIACNLRRTSSARSFREAELTILYEVPDSVAGLSSLSR